MLSPKNKKNSAPEEIKATDIAQRELYQQIVNSGKDAIYNLANYHHESKTLENWDSKTQEYLHSIESMKCAMFSLVDWYDKNSEAPQNKTEAAKLRNQLEKLNSFDFTKKALELALYQLAADLGHAESMCALGCIYSTDDNLAVLDKHKAIIFFRQAASLGSAGAAYALGRSYYSGLGVEKDLDQAVKFFQAACKLPATPGPDFAELASYNIFMVANDYDYGDNGVTKNSVKAVELLKISSALGCSGATSRLAFHYDHGDGEQQDTQRAINLYRKAMDLGSAEAALELAAHYEEGNGVTKNIGEAIKLYQKAVDLLPHSPSYKQPAYYEACYKLGKLYKSGRELPIKDKRLAFKFFNQAASDGSHWMAEYEITKIKALKQ